LLQHIFRNITLDRYNPTWLNSGVQRVDSTDGSMNNAYQVSGIGIHILSLRVSQSTSYHKIFLDHMSFT